MLNVIVAADYTLTDDADAVVIGVDGNGTSYILQPDGEFSTSMSNFEVTDVSGTWTRNHYSMDIQI